MGRDGICCAGSRVAFSLAVLSQFFLLGTGLTVEHDLRDWIQHNDGFVHPDVTVFNAKLHGSIDYRGVKVADGASLKKDSLLLRIPVPVAFTISECRKDKEKYPVFAIFDERLRSRSRLEPVGVLTICLVEYLYKLNPKVFEDGESEKSVEQTAERESDPGNGMTPWNLNSLWENTISGRETRGKFDRRLFDLKDLLVGGGEDAPDPAIADKYLPYFRSIATISVIDKLPLVMMVDENKASVLGRSSPLFKRLEKTASNLRAVYEEFQYFAEEVEEGMQNEHEEDSSEPPVKEEEDAVNENGNWVLPSNPFSTGGTDESSNFKILSFRNFVRFYAFVMSHSHAYHKGNVAKKALETGGNALEKVEVLVKDAASKIVKGAEELLSPAMGPNDEEKEEDIAMLVPYADLVNHATSAVLSLSTSSRTQGTGAGSANADGSDVKEDSRSSGPKSPFEQVESNVRVEGEPGFFEIYAGKDIGTGEELFVSYATAAQAGASYGRANFFQQYGFVEPSMKNSFDLKLQLSPEHPLYEEKHLMFPSYLIESKKRTAEHQMRFAEQLMEAEEQESIVPAALVEAGETMERGVMDMAHYVSTRVKELVDKNAGAAEQGKEAEAADLKDQVYSSVIDDIEFDIAFQLVRDSLWCIFGVISFDGLPRWDAASAGASHSHAKRAGDVGRTSSAEHTSYPFFTFWQCQQPSAKMEKSYKEKILGFARFVAADSLEDVEQSCDKQRKPPLCKAALSSTGAELDAFRYVERSLTQLIQGFPKETASWVDTIDEVYVEMREAEVQCLQSLRALNRHEFERFVTEKGGVVGKAVDTGRAWPAAVVESAVKGDSGGASESLSEGLSLSGVQRPKRPPRSAKVPGIDRFNRLWLFGWFFCMLFYSVVRVTQKQKRPSKIV